MRNAITDPVIAALFAAGYVPSYWYNERGTFVFVISQGGRGRVIFAGKIERVLAWAAEWLISQQTAAREREVA